MQAHVPFSVSVLTFGLSDAVGAGTTGREVDSAATVSSRADFPSVTVVVPTRDRSAMIVDCLQSLLALDYPRLEIVVVDQSSTDATQHAVLDVGVRDPRVRLDTTRSLGVSAARNRAAQGSASQIVAYTDDDCIADPGWLSALVREFEDPDVVAVYGRVLAAGNPRRTGTEVAFKLPQAVATMA